jgi:lipid-binding SYLF domain-containing protein
VNKSIARFLIIAATLCAATAQAGVSEEKRARNATRVLNEIMQAPDKRIPESLLRDAHAVVVIPDVIKAGFVVGGRHGEGVISVKTRDGVWSNPAFVSLTGGSIGFQAGVQSTDVVLVFRSQRGVDSLVNGKFTIGADASAAAGPVGRNAQASTDAQLKAEIFSYSRARGLFAGVALDGSVLSIDHDADQAVYGDGVTPRRVFEGGVRRVPGDVVDFRDRLEEYTARQETARR